MGVVEGGWEFVIGAYAITAVALIGYTLSVLRRYGAERARAERDAREEES